jgi:hypothetical protein
MNNGFYTHRAGIILFLTFLALAFSPALRSQTPVLVYNSFGAGHSYYTGTGWGVTGADTSGGYRGQAQYFVPTVSGYLDQIELATFRVSGSDLSNFFIAQDNGSGVPGSILESWSNVANPNGLLTINSVDQPLLQAGQTYWLCDEPAATNSANAWYENNQGLEPAFAFERSEWDWGSFQADAAPSGVFSVSVVPVPEPSTSALALCGVLVLSRAALSRRKSC